VYQIRFRPGLRPGPNWGAYSAPPGPLAGLRGPTSKGQGAGERGKRGVKGKRKERGKGRERAALLSQIPGYAPEYFALLRIAKWQKESQRRRRV